MVFYGQCEHEVLIHDPSLGCWHHFREPERILTTNVVEEVLPTCRLLDRALEGGGLHAAGFISYEAAPGFDPSLKAKPAGPFPLVWFGLYPREEQFPSQELFERVKSRSYSPQPVPSVNREEYDASIEEIKRYIERGATYQVNYTYRLAFPFDGEPFEYFLQLARAQRAPYPAFLNLGRYAICSASPELFFSLEEDLIRSKPMKGTARRGLTYEEDLKQADWLSHSEKNQAENVMIVDMVRNDIGKIARTGSVQVPELFSIEKYPTLWQMVSTVTGETSARMSEILQALFPPASITGAPKTRTMEIIHELETAPRRIYTGCIGFISPGRKAQFNVAIRTLLIDRAAGGAEYGVGGGITWDSVDAAEYEESLTKATVLSHQAPEFSLLESLLWAPEEGYFLLEEHLERLANSAAYFSNPVDLAQVRERLAGLARSFETAAMKVRLLVDEQGRLSTEAAALSRLENQAPLQVCLAPAPVDSANPFLYHKTTFRQVYEDAQAACQKITGRTWEDVILWNEKGEITEATIANILVELDGALFTPPVRCGLLPGVFRAWLLERGEVQEKPILREELLAGPPIYLVNSVQKMRAATLHHLP
jgi:para-aminobenzoate synthetase/4-amino-4-deoxychorismate lyase